MESTRKQLKDGWSEIEGMIERRLTPLRLAHVLAVRDCAVELARAHGESLEKAGLAGLLHDYARDLPGEELLRIGEEEGLITCEVERQVPILLHGPVGALLVRRELGIDDPEVLEAISLHTLGRPGMGRLAKIVYLADMVAEGRSFPGVEELRRKAFEDLSEALLLGFASTIRYCLETRRLIHPQTLEAWNYFLKEGK
ncbi:MAG: bis(5'-nucleosyl)-tetraphosphatase (symmetrical) YqeK [Thermacetogeniaceae bacterium]